MIAGETEIVAPVPTGVVPQPLAYQFQVAPVPRAPPLTVSVLLVPEQIVAAEAFAEEGAVDTLLTLMSIFSQAVVLQDPTAFT